MQLNLGMNLGGQLKIEDIPAPEGDDFIVDGSDFIVDGSDYIKDEE